MNENNWVDYSLLKITPLIQEAISQRNMSLLRSYVKFINVTIDIEDLIELFKRSCYKISGKKGLASRLGISRNAVYIRFKMMGLSPKDFKKFDATVEKLLRKSKVLRPLLEEVENLLVESESTLFTPTSLLVPQGKVIYLSW